MATHGNHVEIAAHGILQWPFLKTTYVRGSGPNLAPARPAIPSRPHVAAHLMSHHESPPDLDLQSMP